MTGKRFNIHSDEDNETIWISDVQTHKEIEIQHYYGIATVVKMLNDLAEENKQLKTTIQQLTNDNTKQKKKLNTTMKENEQLKCGNKNLKATLNDFINICNRLQSNPTDKQTLGVVRDMLQNMGKELEE